MRIGIDFDNTIANYDGVFYAAARARDLIPEDVDTGKNAVRDYLNGSGRKDEFTELQGYVYGARMDLAAPYDGVKTFVAAATDAGHAVNVVSHKTRHPMMGPSYDLHEAARGFLEDNGFFDAGLIRRDSAFFEITKEDKVARAASLGVDVFIDDLPAILTMAGWPNTTRGILFDPVGTHEDIADLERHISWQSIHTAILG